MWISLVSTGLHMFSYIMSNNLRNLPHDVPISQMEGQSLCQSETVPSLL